MLQHELQLWNSPIASIPNQPLENHIVSPKIIYKEWNSERNNVAVLQVESREHKIAAILKHCADHPSVLGHYHQLLYSSSPLPSSIVNIIVRYCARPWWLFDKKFLGSLDCSSPEPNIVFLKPTFTMPSRRDWTCDFMNDYYKPQARLLSNKRTSTQPQPLSLISQKRKPASSLCFFSSSPLIEQREKMQEIGEKEGEDIKNSSAASKRKKYKSSLNTVVHEISSSSVGVACAQSPPVCDMRSGPDDNHSSCLDCENNSTNLENNNNTSAAGPHRSSWNVSPPLNSAIYNELSPLGEKVFANLLPHTSLIVVASEIMFFWKEKLGQFGPSKRSRKNTQSDVVAKSSNTTKASTPTEFHFQDLRCLWLDVRTVISSLTFQTFLDYDLVFCAASRYSQLAALSEKHHLIWQRVIFDERHWLHLTGNKRVTGVFYWITEIMEQVSQKSGKLDDEGSLSSSSSFSLTCEVLVSHKPELPPTAQQTVMIHGQSAETRQSSPKSSTADKSKAITILLPENNADEMRLSLQPSGEYEANLPPVSVYHMLKTPSKNITFNNSTIGNLGVIHRVFKSLLDSTMLENYSHVILRLDAPDNREVKRKPRWDETSRAQCTSQFPAYSSIAVRHFALGVGSSSSSSSIVQKMLNNASPYPSGTDEQQNQNGPLLHANSISIRPSSTLSFAQILALIEPKSFVLQRTMETSLFRFPPRWPNEPKEVSAIDSPKTRKRNKSGGDTIQKSESSTSPQVEPSVAKQQEIDLELLGNFHHEFCSELERLCLSWISETAKLTLSIVQMEVNRLQGMFQEMKPILLRTSVLLLKILWLQHLLESRKQCIRCCSVVVSSPFSLPRSSVAAPIPPEFGSQTIDKHDDPNPPKPELSSASLLLPSHDDSSRTNPSNSKNNPFINVIVQDGKLSRRTACCGVLYCSCCAPHVKECVLCLQNPLEWEANDDSNNIGMIGKPYPPTSSQSKDQEKRVKQSPHCSKLEKSFSFYSATHKSTKVVVVDSELVKNMWSFYSTSYKNRKCAWNPGFSLSLPNTAKIQVALEECLNLTHLNVSQRQYLLAKVIKQGTGHLGELEIDSLIQSLQLMTSFPYALQPISVSQSCNVPVNLVSAHAGRQQVTCRSFETKDETKETKYPPLQILSMKTAEKQTTRSWSLQSSNPHYTSTLHTQLPKKSRFCMPTDVSLLNSNTPSDNFESSQQKNSLLSLDGNTLFYRHKHDLLAQLLKAYSKPSSPSRKIIVSFSNELPWIYTKMRMNHSKLFCTLFEGKSCQLHKIWMKFAKGLIPILFVEKKWISLGFDFTMADVIILTHPDDYAFYHPLIEAIALKKQAAQINNYPASTTKTQGDLAPNYSLYPPYHQPSSTKHSSKAKTKTKTKTKAASPVFPNIQSPIQPGVRRSSRRLLKKPLTSSSSLQSSQSFSVDASTSNDQQSLLLFTLHYLPAQEDFVERSSFYEAMVALLAPRS